MVATPDFPTMSAAQVAIVQGHWGKVKDQGVEVLYNFLHMFPQNQPVFKAFAGKDLEALKSSPDFAAHATKIMGTFGAVVELLGKDVAGIKKILNDMGKSHKAKSGVTKESFEQFREALLALLDKLFSLDGDAKKAWNLTIDTMFNVLFNNLDGNTVA